MKKYTSLHHQYCILFFILGLQPVMLQSSDDVCTTEENSPKSSNSVKNLLDTYGLLDTPQQAQKKYEKEKLQQSQLMKAIFKDNPQNALRLLEVGIKIAPMDQARLKAQCKFQDEKTGSNFLSNKFDKLQLTQNKFNT
jgi:hypothetical protein